MELFIGIVVVAVVGFIGFKAARLYEGQRTSGLKAVARSLNLRFEDSGSEGLAHSLKSLRLFSRGNSRKLFNLMQGEVSGTALSIFDYRYTTGGGENLDILHQTVILFECPELHLPGFTLGPEKLVHKIGSLLGYQDIDFEAHPQFSKAYLLRGRDEAAIRAVFNDSVLGYLNLPAGLSLEGLGRRLLYWKDGGRVLPNEIEGFLREGLAVFALFSKSNFANCEGNGKIKPDLMAVNK